MRFSKNKVYFYQRGQDLFLIGTGAFVNPWIQKESQDGDQILETKLRAVIKKEQLQVTNIIKPKTGEEE